MKKLNVLIVDDNEAFRQSLRHILVRHFPFMQVSQAGEGEGALNSVAQRIPDLVFMDIRMPGKNGLDIIRIIKSTDIHPLICVITSFDLPEYRDAAFCSGADHFIVKDESTEAAIISVVDGMLSGLAT
ncbi:MAG: response regulator transcription factor [Sulfuricella denitrificans]|nr:response regulator transcription factor [Sulfuricella denitrificans]